GSGHLLSSNGQTGFISSPSRVQKARRMVKSGLQQLPRQPDGLPWQLAMFQRSLKKQLKLTALLEFVGDSSAKRCLLVTCGDNTGALNWHLRNRGGAWSWGDVEGAHLAEMSRFLGEPVYHLQPNQLPFADAHFDCVVSIDVLEHLHDDQTFLR